MGSFLLGKEGRCIRKIILLDMYDNRIFSCNGGYAQLQWRICSVAMEDMLNCNGGYAQLQWRTCLTAVEDMLSCNGEEGYA